jgi:hypothetical protein
MCGIVFTGHVVAAVQTANTKTDVLPISSAFTPDSAARKILRVSPVNWNGRDYAPEEAVPILMSVIVDKGSEARVRLDALGKMKLVSNQISGTAWVDGLVSHYDRALPLDEKSQLLKCLVHTADPRAFAVFTKVLDEEKDRTIRLVAAAGLAQWNVRRGVAELLAQLNPQEAVTGEPSPTNEAMKALAQFSRYKGWELWNEVTWERIEARADLDRNQKVATFVAEMRRWFEQNEHRFPEWKPGDRLPEIPPLHEARPDGP